MSFPGCVVHAPITLIVLVDSSVAWIAMLFRNLSSFFVTSAAGMPVGVDNLGGHRFALVLDQECRAVRASRKRYVAQKRDVLVRDFEVPFREELADAARLLLLRLVAQDVLHVLEASVYGLVVDGNVAAVGGDGVANERVVVALDRDTAIPVHRATTAVCCYFVERGFA